MVILNLCSDKSLMQRIDALIHFNSMPMDWPDIQVMDPDCNYRRNRHNNLKELGPAMNPH
jgi:hypothetical protein